jgi:hypothetical protein
MSAKVTSCRLLPIAKFTVPKSTSQLKPGGEEKNFQEILLYGDDRSYQGVTHALPNLPKRNRYRLSLLPCV